MFFCVSRGQIFFFKKGGQPKGRVSEANPRETMSDVVTAFISLLESAQVSQYADALLRNQYHLGNVGKLTESDLKKMRITNKRDVQVLLGLAQRQREDEDRGGADATSVEAASSTDASPARQFTATAPTANEWCRQATLFIAHHRVDRAWPRSGSAMARSLALSTAVPFRGSSTAYTVKLPDAPEHPRASRSPIRIAPASSQGSPRSDPSQKSRWKPALHAAFARSFGPAPPMIPRVASSRISPTKVTPVSRIAAGFQSHTAKFCPVCEERLDTTMSEGQWQHRLDQRIQAGDGQYEWVPVWVPFGGIESLQLEHGTRHHERLVPNVGRYTADLQLMKWGPHAIRRVASVAIPFPSLSVKEIVRPPPFDAAAQSELDDALQGTFIKLIVTEEERARCYLVHCSHQDLDTVLGEIAAMMEEYWAWERSLLEADEEVARGKVFAENFELKLDNLWAAVERSVDDVRFAESRRSSDNVVFQQRTLVSRMEELARDDVLLHERAAFENLARLFSRFNTQIKTMLANKTVSLVADATLRCPLCKEAECIFFRHPWRGQWKHRGLEGGGRGAKSAVSRRTSSPIGGAHDGAGDDPEVANHDTSEATAAKGFGTLAGLWQRAKELEFEEFLDGHRHRSPSQRRAETTSPSRGPPSPRIMPSTNDAATASPRPYVPARPTIRRPNTTTPSARRAFR